MYALANVRKFVEDNKDRLGNLAVGILARAEQQSSNGVLSGSAVEGIMQDHELAREFHEVVMSDPDHLRIGLEALLQYGVGVIHAIID
ncbi:MAG: hypothetical protein UY92_C0006G0034 [Candidatus Magasanikbacteria bacterium GW2011_GWA2_56_11]|uniref:Uncharacterized protein n=1 Tax=Candidatus Magasanikbacteria bacterium GW2011_GWA2_56_11 TaxID=1619044 RepID=A0A0G1YGA2_9BACT|nr:MAG: hypothetical protein UY92_C0006G0034 [Candidatus Magasanikbacteria bacterium GW2011_GWA2_56_11]